MIRFFEQLVISIWNFLNRPRKGKTDATGMVVGYEVVEGQTTGRRVTLSHTRRTMHVAVLGKTGSGKSSLLRSMCLQDIAAGRGFLFFDLHGEDTKFILKAIAARERELKAHLSDRLIVISPADPGCSVGLNPLEQAEPDFVQIAEFAEILKVRWGLDHFGARTDELLRNSLYVLSANGLTLLELGPLLTDSGFRARCLKNTPNQEVRQYFEVRYGQASDPMKATMREPILNKTSAFTADPRFRHIVGQAKSTFSIREAMDQGYWIIADLPKGKARRTVAYACESFAHDCQECHLHPRQPFALHHLLRRVPEPNRAVERHRDRVVRSAKIRGVGDRRQPVPRSISHGDACGDLVGRDPYLLSAIERGRWHRRPDARRRQVTRREVEESAAATIRREVGRRALAGGNRCPRSMTAKETTPICLNRSRGLRALPRPQVEREIAARHAALSKSTDEVLNDWE